MSTVKVTIDTRGIHIKLPDGMVVADSRDEHANVGRSLMVFSEMGDGSMRLHWPEEVNVSCDFTAASTKTTLNFTSRLYPLSRPPALTREGKTAMEEVDGVEVEDVKEEEEKQEDVKVEDVKEEEEEEEEEEPITNKSLTQWLEKSLIEAHEGKKGVAYDRMFRAFIEKSYPPSIQDLLIDIASGAYAIAADRTSAVHILLRMFTREDPVLQMMVKTYHLLVGTERFGKFLKAFGAKIDMFPHKDDQKEEGVEEEKAKKIKRTALSVWVLESVRKIRDGEMSHAPYDGFFEMYIHEFFPERLHGLMKAIVERDHTTTLSNTEWCRAFVELVVCGDNASQDEMRTFNILVGKAAIADFTAVLGLVGDRDAVEHDPFRPGAKYVPGVCAGCDEKVKERNRTIDAIKQEDAKMKEGTLNDLIDEMIRESDKKDPLVSEEKKRCMCDNCVRSRE